MKRLDKRVRIAVWAQQVLAQNFKIIDLETTGLNATSDYIVQVAIIDQVGQSLLNQLINPGVPIPQPAIDTHGITDEAVADAPTWEQVLPQVEALLLTDTPVGVYNLSFEKRFLAANGVRVAGVQWMPCIMQQYAQFWGAYNRRHQSYIWQSLTSACQQQGVIVHNAHDALADCRMALKLIYAMAGGDA